MQPETLDQTCRAAQRTANLLRLAMEGPANEALVTFVDGMTELLANAPLELADPIGSVLVEDVSAQGRGDVLRVADLVEFELRPLLREAQASS